MTPTGDVGADEGGEAPCFAHLFDEPERLADDVVLERPGPSPDDGGAEPVAGDGGGDAPAPTGA